MFLIPQAYAEGMEGFKQLDNETINQINPLRIGQDAAGGSTVDLHTPGAVITRIIEFAFPIAGLILFVMIMWGGFEIITGAATKKNIDAGRQRIQSALIGFILLFVSYWLMKVIEAVFGLEIL